ncbi:MAG: amino acid adenylation domain-containing protein, partial [Minicystis sp.]
EVDKALRADRGLALPPLVKEAPGTARPLSFAQERLWFLDQLAPGDTSYNLPMAIPLGGALDQASLQRALSELCRRHESLRTTFGMVEGKPVQIVHEATPCALPLTALSSLPEAERTAKARSEALTEASLPFDLARGPLFRARLFELDTGAHLLVLTMHHIVSDGWSLDVLRREVAALYEAFRLGEPSPLPELPVQYADYAAWQRRWLDGEVLDKQLGYWREALGGAPQAIELPTDRPRPLLPSHRGGKAGFSLSLELSQALYALARRENATLFMVLLAAYDVLLHRYTGQDELLVGSPIAGRTIADTEGLIGFFVNTLVLRARFAEGITFSGLLAEVREACLGAYAHQDAPFERLVAELAPQRDLGRTPLFQAMFSLQNVPREKSGREVPSAAQTGVSADDATAKFDLTLVMAEGKKSIAGHLEYALDLFDASTAERMAGHFVALLQAIVQTPKSLVRELPMLGTEERETLLFGWNATDASYPQEATIHGLFEARAAQTPDATALLFEGREIAYRALNEDANRLAHHLRSLGAGKETPVGICVERSPSMVVVLLAALKIGAPYVPLDPAYPPERLALMIEISRLSILVTQTKIEGSLPVRGLQVVCLDQEGGPLASSSSTNPDVPVDPWDIAYVMYTSGSTGIPKGVSGTHTGAINRFAWMWRTFPFQPGELSSQKTTLSFVDSVWEIFGPLLVGVPALLIADEVLKDTRRFIDALGEHRVTRLVLVPSLLRAMLDTHSDLDARLPALKYWTTSGEALPSDLCKRFLTELPGRLLLNLYGSTEVSADATYYLAQAGAVGARIPIGKPMDNTQVYLLDARREPVPVGVTGELYVGGIGVARGYLHRPDLTAERFLPDPFRPGPRALLFKTGDLGRYLPNGDIEYLGRADYQVKVRGFRIELGEVESAISQHLSVKQVVVTARDYGDNDRRLIAYVVRSETAASAGDLRTFVKERLPEYMVPSVFVYLDKLPLTPSGKVDRKSLPTPDRVSSAERFLVAARGPTEAALVGIFAEVLKIPPENVSIHDGFFELGGHSLLATQAISRIRGALGVELPLRNLFEAPTPAELGKRVDEAARGGQALTLPKLERAPAGGPRPLSFAQERLWFLDQLTPGETSYNMPVAMALNAALDAGALRRALSVLVRRHEAL